MRFLFLLSLLLFFGASVSAQENYWIFFRDKDPNSLPSLSPRALENRIHQGIKVNFDDLPVRSFYQNQLTQAGIKPVFASRWLNAIYATLTPAQHEYVRSLPFVVSVSPASSLRTNLTHSPLPQTANQKQYTSQLEMLGLDRLHRNGYTGKGVIIAVFDNGFSRVDSLEGFKAIFREKRLLATRDFVDGDDDVFEPCSQCGHGTQVLSVLATNLPGQLTGAAPEASYILIRTENSYEETKAEEALFVEAAEWADSLGAQIFNLSYGYRYFDPGEGDYSVADFDGNTAIITLAAEKAASRGIHIFASVGNYGTFGLQAPADGESVLAIGGVDAEGIIYASSGRGPTANGRIKPDLVAMGEGVVTLTSSGTLRNSNGTSFSAPLVAGLAATLLQANPHFTNTELRQALLQSADRYTSPNNTFGYGIPYGPEVLQKRGIPLTDSATFSPDPFDEKNILLFPNPSTRFFTLMLDPLQTGFEAEIRINDATGRTLFHDEWIFQPGQWQYAFELNFQPGIYNLIVREKQNRARKFAGKLVLLPD
ncbi:MAG: S8 family serine peptidase [Bacteroidia bacterium]|nr:S8 family serine peptidase [Bacteroidia bacterium]